MKKLIASVFLVSVVMSLAACNRTKEPEKSAFAISEIVNRNSEETSTTASSESSSTETTASYKNVSECVKDVVEKTTMMVPAGDEDNEEPEECVYHYPQLLIKSSYADEVNKEIASAVEKYMKDVKKTEDADEVFISTEYIAYLTKEGILSMVFISDAYYEYCRYKIYNIDTKTGEKVDNARIAQAAGVSSIRKAAMDALQNLYNKMEIFQFKDYKIVLKKGEKKDTQMKDVEKTFSEKHLNDKMQIGLTSEGKMFFVSEIDTTAGAEFYNYIYDADGVRLDDEDNPFWVGKSESDDTEEPTGTAKAPSAKILRKKDYVVNARKEYQKKYFEIYRISYERRDPEHRFH